MNAIQNFMTADEAEAYSLAAGLAAANESDRAAWSAGVKAEKNAEYRAIQQWQGEVKLNRHGRPAGGVHPAIANLEGRLNLDGCYASA